MLFGQKENIIQCMIKFVLIRLEGLNKEQSSQQKKNRQNAHFLQGKRRNQVFINREEQQKLFHPLIE